jgi:hypothetical protein
MADCTRRCLVPNPQTIENRLGRFARIAVDLSLYVSEDLGRSRPPSGWLHAASLQPYEARGRPCVDDRKGLHRILA